MRLILSLMIFTSSGFVLADQVLADLSATDVTIDRGLQFLKADALRWKNDHQCASCHHASQIVWAMNEARRINHPVDERLLSELTTWIAQAGDGTTSVPRPEGIPKALNTKAIYYSLALASNPTPDEESKATMRRMLITIQNDQLDNGSWAAWPESRAPYFGNFSESMSALAVLALHDASISVDGQADPARDKGMDWVMKNQSEGESQSLALRLVLCQRLGRPSDQIEFLVNQVKVNQNVDGGWSQNSEMSSDAWATGQMLYALGVAHRDSQDPAVARGQSFLVKSQQSDGSWVMTSRPAKPGGEGSKNLIPIIGGGSAWAVIGLCRSR